MREVWVAIPAFNEESIVRETVAEVRRAFSNVVVVDDCSSDRTKQFATEAGAVVCRHPVNLGQGAALQTGISYALRQGAEVIVTFDADGQHRVQDALAMVDELQRYRVDVVLASRFLGAAEGMPTTRAWLLRLATFYTRLTTGLALTDTHNGLRVLSRRAAHSISLRQNRMAHASEILGQIAQNRLAYREYPVTVMYTPYSRAKGQRTSGAISVILDLFLRKLFR